MNGPDSRVARLEALKSILAERDFLTAPLLAAELGVSERTVHRDLATLREQGVPIDSQRGLGGGLRLERGWSLGRVHLNDREAISMLLSLTIAEKVGSPVLLADLRAVTRKINAAFAPQQARRIRSLRSRVLIGEPASTAVLAGYRPPGPAVTGPVLESFADQRMLAIEYTDTKRRTTERDVEPQCLYFNLPVWYLLGWDRLRDGVRFFRLDRIHRATRLSTAFLLRPAGLYESAGEPDARTL
jgi:predicted DNA-binding transcriptional regulator YafY